MVRTDNMHGTVFGGDLVSVRYASEIKNGCFLVPGAYETGAREVRTGAAMTTSTALSALVLVASEEVDKSKKYDTVAGYVNPANAISRGYKLNAGDVFSITADCFDTEVTPTVGTSVLEAAAGVKASLVNSATSATKIADLVAIETEGATTWYVFRV